MLLLGAAGGGPVGGLISGGVGALAEYGALFLDKKLSLKSIGKSYIPCVSNNRALFHLWWKENF